MKTNQVKTGKESASKTLCILHLSDTMHDIKHHISTIDQPLSQTFIEPPCSKIIYIYMCVCVCVCVYVGVKKKREGSIKQKPEEIALPNVMIQ
jgi:hypothetical protein